MILASPELITLLNSSDQFLMADLFTFELNNGSVLRYTSLDIDLAVNGHAFSSALPIRRNAISIKAGLDADELGLTIYPSPSDLVSGVPFVQAVNHGMFDGAAFTLERAFFGPTWQTFVGKIIRFMGNVSDIEEFSRTEVPMTIKSTLELLNVNIPRKVYQAGCGNTLFDNDCMLSKVAYAVASYAQAGSTKTLINCGLTQAGPIYSGGECVAAGYFDLGVITFSSGANSGTSRTVKAYSPGAVSLALPLPFAPATGDTFTIYPGCDKTQGTCSTKFGNLAHYAGFPYVPPAEAAY